MEDLKVRTETPFPLQQPHIETAPTNTPLFEVDFKEMHWWFAIPEVGDHVLWAEYEPICGCPITPSLRPFVQPECTGLIAWK